MSKTLCITNNKGGVGKTHSAFHLAGALAEIGHRVLVVDLDPQANLTGLLLHSTPRPSIFDVLSAQLPLAAITCPSTFPNIHVAPSDGRMEDLESTSRNEPDARFRLVEAIRERQDQAAAYDFVILDCPPNLGLPTVNALLAADGVVIPLEADKFSVHGLNRLLVLIEQMRGLNDRLRVEGLLISLYKSRRLIQRTFDDALKRYPGVHVLDVRIKDSVEYQEAINAGKPITYYRPKGDCAEAFRRLAAIVASPAEDSLKAEPLTTYAVQP